MKRLLLVLLMLSACVPEDRVATQLLVSVYADREVAATLRQVRASLYAVDASDESMVTTQLPFALIDRPMTDAQTPMLLSFGITPGKADRFKLVLEGYDSTDSGAVPVIEQKALASFEDHQKLRIDVLLGRACIGKAQTCSGLQTTCAPLATATVAAGACGELPIAKSLPTLQSIEDAGVGVPFGAVRQDAGTDASTVREDASVQAPPGEADAAMPVVDAATPVATWSWPPSGCEVVSLRMHAYDDVNAPQLLPQNTITTQIIDLDAPWGNDTVQAIAWRGFIDNGDSVKQWNLGSKSEGAPFLFSERLDPISPQLPADVALPLPSGAASLRLTITYQTPIGGGTQSDRSGVDLCIIRTNLRPKSLAVTTLLNVTSGVLAPPNTSGNTVSSMCRITSSQTVHLVSSAPYMRYRGVSSRLSVTRLSGGTFTIAEGPFNYPLYGSTALNPEITLEAGDVLTTSCTYNNPTGDSFRYGETLQSSEACFNFALYYPKGALTCATMLP